MLSFSIPFKRNTWFFLLLSLPLVSFSTTSLSGIYDYEVTVLDERGKPFYGVNVFTDDLKKVATTTDEKGKAILKDLDYRENVNFSFIGYVTRRIPFFELRKMNGIVKMERSVEELKEVVVIGRRDDTPEQVPYDYDKISKEDIAFTESQTTADALAQNAGVFVQKTQMGGGSPVLRGFEANRVLLVVDGVRMNTAIYRSGHLQNTITVDNAMLERTEVIYGPGSLLYGSDALGGVIHFRSKEPKLYLDNTPGKYIMEGGLYARYASANEEKSVHGEVNYGKNRWAAITSFTFTDYNDLRAGGNRPDGYEDFGKRLFLVRRVGNDDQVIENVIQSSDGNFTSNYNVQVGTAYSQMDFMQKIKFQPSKYFYTVLNFQNSTSTDIPRYDFLTETTDPSDPSKLRYAEWFYGPQRRMLLSLKSRLSKKTALYDRATFIAAHQRVHENRLQRRLHKSQRTYQLEDVWAYSFTGDFDKGLDSAGQHKLLYGVDANFNDVNSEGGKVKISDESLTHDALSRYPGENTMTMLAGYTTYQWNTKDTSLTLHAGLRYNLVKLFSQYANDSLVIWPANYYDPGIGMTNSDLTWSLGATWRSGFGTEFRAIASKAFRNPNIDDYSQFRPQNGFISVPNPDLKPERSYNGELGLSQSFGKIINGSGTRFGIDLTGYYTVVKGLMTRRAFPLPDGTNLLEQEGELLETRAMVNARKGIIYGGSAEVLLQLGSKWQLSSTLAYTRGVSEFVVNNSQGEAIFDTLAPLDHIPPMYGKTSLTYQTERLKLSAVARYQGAKTPDLYGVSKVTLDENGKPVLARSGTEDNLEYAYTRKNEDGQIVNDGTLAWTTYNFYASLKLTKWYSVNVAVENILDLHYRPFSSGVSAAGRNLIVSFRVNLGK
jgi:hemoglobin/transferrin/lactoferrin receptor protein